MGFDEEMYKKHKFLGATDRREYKNLVKANEGSAVKRTFNDIKKLVNLLHTNLRNCLDTNDEIETAMRRQKWLIQRTLIDESSPKASEPEQRRRRLVEAAYYSFIGFNMFLMCGLLVGISFAYHIGTH